MISSRPSRPNDTSLDRAQPRSEPVVGQARCVTEGVHWKYLFDGHQVKVLVALFAFLIRCAKASLQRWRGHRIIFDVGKDLFFGHWFGFLGERAPKPTIACFVKGMDGQLQHRNPGQGLVGFSLWRCCAHAPSHDLHRLAAAWTEPWRARLDPGFEWIGNKL